MWKVFGRVVPCVVTVGLVLESRDEVEGIAPEQLVAQSKVVDVCARQRLHDGSAAVACCGGSRCG
eukprot:3089693-Amphidinium_carterae.2